MRPGREIDARVAKEIFGYEVWAKNKVLHEKTEAGDRPLRAYSKDMTWAWEVAAKMRISLVPIDEAQWFAFASGKSGWESPEHFLEYLRGGDFRTCGAAVGDNPAQVICEAALVANDKAKLAQLPPEEASISMEKADERAVESEIVH